MVTLVLSLALALLPHHTSSAGDRQGGATRASHRVAALPVRGIFTPGNNLAGVHLGDSAATVEALWGTDYQVCQGCKITTWLFLHPDTHVGAGIKLDRHAKVIGIFTLGSPLTWRTSDGLRVGELIQRVIELYGNTGFQMCKGYGAMTIRTGDSVTTFYDFGEIVYGFALTTPSTPVCS
jgi:hypothetical protein